MGGRRGKKERKKGILLSLSTITCHCRNGIGEIVRKRRKWQRGSPTFLSWKRGNKEKRKLLRALDPGR